MIKAKTSTKKTATKKAVAKKAAPKVAPKKAAVKKAEPQKVVATTKTTTVKKAAPKAAPVKKGTKIITSSINGVGRRKSSVARVWLSKGKGDIAVNGRTVDTYFTTETDRTAALKALTVSGKKDTYNIKINVKGGGPCSQADAVKLGLARALLKDNESLREILRKHDLLTVDARVKERKKPGQRAARRKFQFVKR